MNINYCPKCGYHINNNEHNYHSMVINRVGAGTLSPFLSQHIKPTRAPSLNSDGFTPLLQSLVGGFYAFCILLIPLAAVGIAFKWSMFFGVVVAAVIWNNAINHHRSLLSEQLTYETPPPPPPPEQQTVVIIPTKSGSNQVKTPVPFDMFTKFAKGVIKAKRPLSSTEWVGKGRLFTRNEFDNTRQWLLINGIIEWADISNKKAGVKLTKAGRSMLSAIASGNYTKQ